MLIARPQEKRDQDEDYGFYDWKDQNDHVLGNEWKRKKNSLQDDIIFSFLLVNFRKFIIIWKMNMIFQKNEYLW